MLALACCICAEHHVIQNEPTYAEVDYNEGPPKQPHQPQGKDK